MRLLKSHELKTCNILPTFPVDCTFHRAKFPESRTHVSSFGGSTGTGQTLPHLSVVEGPIGRSESASWKSISSFEGHGQERPYLTQWMNQIISESQLPDQVVNLLLNYHWSKFQVDDFVGELTFQNQSINALCQIRMEGPNQPLGTTCHLFKFTVL